jgi:phosphomannomutase
MQDYIIDKLTISGFRGILGEALTDESVSLFALAFIQSIKERTGKEQVHILLGRDGRESGEEIEQTIANTIVNNGDDVTVGGILTTPSVLYLTKTLTFDGALIITASHNPEEYNGLKFITEDGFFATKEIIEKMKLLISENKIDLNKIPETKGTAIEDLTLKDSYINHVVSAFEKSKTKPRVIIDTVNSSGSIMAPEFLRALGAEVIVINDEPVGTFGRPPEPNPAALKELGRATLGYGMDVGFGLDPDGDRLVVVDENGIVVFEEYTLALTARAFYEKISKENATPAAGPLIINGSTSRTVEDVAERYGVKTLRSPVGEANVVKKMKENNSMFGGEGSGGVIFRPINFGRDSFVGMALILNLMEESGKKISELVEELPKYVMLKEKIGGIYGFKDYIPELKNLFHSAEINEEDGIRFDFPDQSWLSVRASNTEPIVRIIGEAKDEKTIINLINRVKEVF